MGIDPSLTSTGYVILDKNEIVVNGIIMAKESGIARLFSIKREIKELLVDFSPKLVVIEGYAFARANQAHQMGELGGMVRMLLDEGFYRWLEVSPGQLKKFATGKGNSTKDVILMHVYKRWKVEFNDNNIADAFVLAKIGQSVLGDTKGLTQDQLDIIKALRKKVDG